MIASNSPVASSVSRISIQPSANNFRSIMVHPTPVLRLLPPAGRATSCLTFGKIKGPLLATVMAVAACNSSTAPATPLAAADLGGSYVVTFEHENAGTLNPARSCTRVSADLTAMSWLPMSCQNTDVTPMVLPTGIVVRNDSVFLKVVQRTNTRDIILTGFSGAVDRADARFV